MLETPPRLVPIDARKIRSVSFIGAILMQQARRFDLTQGTHHSQTVASILADQQFIDQHLQWGMNGQACTSPWPKDRPLCIKKMLQTLEELHTPLAQAIVFDIFPRERSPHCVITWEQLIVDALSLVGREKTRLIIMDRFVYASESWLQDMLRDHLRAKNAKGPGDHNAQDY